MSIMSIRNDNIERRSGTLRTTRDLVMGIFYTAIGVILLYNKSFANIPVPPVIAYIIGGILTIGGTFRFYRGFKMLFSQKKDEDVTN